MRLPALIATLALTTAAPALADDDVMARAMPVVQGFIEAREQGRAMDVAFDLVPESVLAAAAADNGMTPDQFRAGAKAGYALAQRMGSLDHLSIYPENAISGSWQGHDWAMIPVETRTRFGADGPPRVLCQMELYFTDTGRWYRMGLADPGEMAAYMRAYPDLMSNLPLTTPPRCAAPAHS